MHKKKTVLEFQYFRIKIETDYGDFYDFIQSGFLYFFGYTTLSIINQDDQIVSYKLGISPLTSKRIIKYIEKQQLSNQS